MADLRSQLLAELPPLPELDKAELEWLIHRPPDGENNEAVLGLLVGDQQQMEAAEWRLLGQLAGLQARLVPCHRLSDICANLQQTGRLPRPVLFRPQGGYDIHYGHLLVRLLYLLLHAPSCIKLFPLQATMSRFVTLPSSFVAALPPLWSCWIPRNTG